MIPQRIRVKLYAKDASETDSAPFVALFHDFIRESCLPGLWIDVVDYGHVPRGPGALLIGHEADLSWDTLDGLPGLSFTRKRGEAKSLEAALRHTLECALRAAAAVETRSRTRLSRTGIGVTCIDRLRVAHDEVRLAPLRAALEAAAEHALPGHGPVTIERGDPRACVSLRI
ncbi:MAG: hypothetical protein GXP55_13345 [Deltaproteobacteria bacterium]|nr:hypothetical protein [Deltaproteobacteria bacterium]